MFIIDQVDAFVRACKQTLLYNVLDALTSSNVQVRLRHTALTSAVDSHLVLDCKVHEHGYSVDMSVKK